MSLTSIWDRNRKKVLLGFLCAFFVATFGKAISASQNADQKVQEITQIYKACGDFCENKGNKFKIRDNECLCFSVKLEDKRKL